jgi:hypothetical protein
MNSHFVIESRVPGHAWRQDVGVYLSREEAAGVLKVKAAAAPEAEFQITEILPVRSRRKGRRG